MIGLGVVIVGIVLWRKFGRISFIETDPPFDYPPAMPIEDEWA